MTTTLTTITLALTALTIWQNTQLRRVRHTACTDALTGCLNRRAWDQRTTGRTGTWIMIDLDHFKQINDTHGHAAGDDVLRAAGRVLRSVVRVGDVLARYGGEEFAVFLPRGSKDEALEVAARVHAALRDGAVGVTASVGVGGSLAEADAAVYAAKAGGRDRTVAA